MDDNTNNMKAIVKLFVDSLVAQGVVEHDDVFIEVNDRAKDHGYKIVADQLGARGTFVHFSKE